MVETQRVRFSNVSSDRSDEAEPGWMVTPEDYESTESNRYVLHEDGEQIYCLIKSNSDEYCFTNFAFIHLNGSRKKSNTILLSRLPYYLNPISNVSMETAGWVDVDLELTFNAGDRDFSVYARQDSLSQVQNLYKALVKISEIQQDNKKLHEYAANSLNTASHVLQNIQKSESNVEEQFKALNQYAFSWMKSAKSEYVKENFGDVFEKFVKH